MGTTVSHLLTLLFPLLVGFLVRLAMTGLKHASGAVDSLPAWAKQVVVVLIAAILSLAGTYFHVDLGSSLDGVTEASLTTILSAIFAMVTHNGSKLQRLDRGSRPLKRDAGRFEYGGGLVILLLLSAGVMMACGSKADRPVDTGTSRDSVIVRDTTCTPHGTPACTP